MFFSKPKKSKVLYAIYPQSIVVNFDGKTRSIKKEDQKHAQVLKCIKENRLDDIKDIVDSVGYFEQNGFEVKDGLLHVDGEPLPEVLSQRVLAFQKEGLPFEALIKFWQNLRQNPSYNSRTMLYKFLEHNGHPLTDDGCFIAYRGVSKDFKDLHTGKFDNSIGSICRVSRTEVDDNPNNTCSRGLHVASFDYAKDFGQQLIEVKVNPMNVVAVPTDYNGTKMRVCEFEVVALGEKPRTESLYGREPTESVDNEGQVTFEDECDDTCPHCGTEFDDLF